MRLSFDSNILLHSADSDVREKQTVALDQDGRVLGGVPFVNPFNPKNAELLSLALPER